MFEYTARLVTATTADILDLDIDLGFGVRTRQRIQLVGIRCAERGTIAGDDALAYTRAWIDDNGPHLTLRSVRPAPGKPGRYRGAIIARTRVLNTDLIMSGLATAFDDSRPSYGLGEAFPGAPVP